MSFLYYITCVIIFLWSMYFLKSKIIYISDHSYSIFFFFHCQMNFLLVKLIFSASLWDMHVYFYLYAFAHSSCTTFCTYFLVAKSSPLLKSTSRLVHLQWCFSQHHLPFLVHLLSAFQFITLVFAVLCHSFIISHTLFFSCGVRASWSTRLSTLVIICRVFMSKQALILQR